MQTEQPSFIGGKWTAGSGSQRLVVINPATEEVLADLPAASADDVDRAVRSASEALPGWSNSSLERRGSLLRSIADGLDARNEEIGDLIAQEMGMPAQ